MTGSRHLAKPKSQCSCDCQKRYKHISGVCCAGSSNASVAMDLPPDVVSKAWADIGRPSEVAKQRLAVRALSAAARYVHAQPPVNDG